MFPQSVECKVREGEPYDLRITQRCGTPADLEAAFLVEQAQDRRTVLACLFCFDILTFVVRSLQLLIHKGQHRDWTTIVPQMVNMSILWAVIYCINHRSRKSQGKAVAALQV